jgi:hypothetical protein
MRGTSPSGMWLRIPLSDSPSTHHARSDLASIERSRCDLLLTQRGIGLVLEPAGELELGPLFALDGEPVFVDLRLPEIGMGSRGARTARVPRVGGTGSSGSSVGAAGEDVRPLFSRLFRVVAPS